MAGAEGYVAIGAIAAATPGEVAVVSPPGARIAG